MRMVQSFIHRTLLCAFLITAAAGYPSFAQQDEPPETGATEVSQLSLDFFPIFPWDSLFDLKEPGMNVEQELKDMMACNFNMPCFVTPEELPLCEKLGVRAIVRPEDCVSGYIRRHASDEEIEKRVIEIIEETGESEALFGYFIMDEPPASLFSRVAKAVATVKEHAPGKLAYVNLLPDHASPGQLGAKNYTEYLERFVNEVKPQFVSYDNYRVQYSNDQAQADVAESHYTNLIEARRIGLKYDLPLWNTGISNQIRSFTTVPSPANFALQAYTTLAVGGRGMMWYTYYPRGYAYAPIGKDGHKTLSWLYLQGINKQLSVLGPIMNRLTSTGVYFTDPAPVAGFDLLPGKLVEAVEADTPFMVGEFSSNDGADYVMLVNLSLEKSANLKFTTQGEYAAKEIISAMDGSLQPLDEENGTWLVAGQGVLIKLTR